MLLSLVVKAEYATAQQVNNNRPVSGRIVLKGKTTNEKGESLAGASIKLKDSEKGTISSAGGNFSLTVNKGDTVVVSFLGYNEYQFVVKDNRDVMISLTTSLASSLSDVIVIGYGTQKKATITGAISTVKGDDIVTTKNENVLNTINGKVSGVRIVQKSSEPGSFNNSFDIRGFGNPLIIIDGVPRDNITRIDPYDIEDISILKDASAAIYGVRAANGVVLITTRQGKAGHVDLTYSGSYGIQKPSNLPDMLNAVDYMTLTNEQALHNVNNVNQTPVFSQDEIEAYRNGTKKSTDWGIVVRHSAPQIQHNLSASGGSDKVKYFISAGELKQEGFWKSGDLNYEKFNFRSNISARISKSLIAEMRVSGITETKNQPYSDAWVVFKSLWTQIPTLPIYANNNPLYLGEAADGANTIALTNSSISGYKKFVNKWFQGALSLTYDIPFLQGLKAKATYSYDYDPSDSKEYKKQYSLYSYNAQTDVYVQQIVNAPSSILRRYTQNTNTLMQLSLDYSRKFGTNHNVSAFAVYEENSRNGDNFYASRELTLDAVDQLFAGNALNQAGTMDPNGLFKLTNKSFAGRLSYDYATKYMVQFSSRYDGSSKFAPGKQWGFFPAALIGWRISEENFFKNTHALSFVNNLKIRATYGILGDDNSSTYQFLTGYNYPSGGYIFNGSYVNGLGFRGTPNPNITWFKAKTLNVGIDADMWHGLLGFQLDIFQRKRDGLLATRLLSLPGTVGANLPQENLNSDLSRGFEVTFYHRNKIRDFHYGISGNFSYSRTLLQYVEQAKAGNSYVNWTSNSSNRYNDVWWGYTYAGQFTSIQDIINSTVVYDGAGNRSMLPGDSRYEDWNGDGIIDGWDSHPIATKDIPHINYGFTISSEYKGFDLSLLFQGTFMVNVQYQEQLSAPLGWGRSGLSMFTDRWHTANPTANPFDPNTVWIPGYFGNTGSGSAGTTSDRTVHNASYLRLKSIEIGYTLPKDWTMKAGIKSVRIYSNGYNLFTITKLKYLDPEHPSDTYGYLYPLNRTINFGLNITF